MRLYTAFTTLLFLGLSIQQASATELRPINHEDVWKMNRLGSPVVGPQGKLAIISVTEPSYEKDEDISDLWLIRIDGDAAPRRLTSTREGESSVTWRADGKAIAFTSKRGDDKAKQVYVLDMTGPGEAIRITNLSTGCSNPVWSPDGKMITFDSRVYPGASDDEANKEEKKTRDERKFNVSAYDIFPIRQWDHWRDDRQVHLFVQEPIAGATARDVLAGSALVREPGFSGTPTRSGSSLKAVWTPDGKSLVFNATTNLDEAAHARVLYRLYSVNLEGGEPTQLTNNNDWNCSGPKFSANGKQLYCKYASVNEHVYNLSGIGRFDWSTTKNLGDPKVITRGFDRSVSNFEISTNGKTLFLTAADAGRVRIYSLPAKGGKAKALNPDSRGVYAGIQIAGKQLVAKWENSELPAEVVRVHSSGRHEAITAFNAERVKGIDLKPSIEFWFENSNGRRVHSWLVLPAGFDQTKTYPLVLQIHGGPFSTSADAGHVRWSPTLLAAPGYVVLRTDFTGSVGYGEQFSRDIGGDPLKTPGNDLLEAARVAIERYPFIDGSRQAATGASYGGHLVNWLQGTTTHFKALVGHAGLVDLEGQYTSSDTIFNREIMNGGPTWSDSPVWREQSPSTYADRFSTPILLTIGEKDFRVPINQTIAAWSYVQRKQVPGRLLVFHDANHWIMKGEEARYFWEELHAWLAKYLLD